MTSRVLVAGGRGFIGRHVVAALQAAGHEAVAAGRDDLPRTLGEGAWDAVVWAAGHRAPDDETLHEQHVAAPLRALAGASPGRFVYLSSGELYGRQDAPFAEDAPLLGDSPYARAKLDGERQLASAAEAHGTALVVLRLAVVYGPGQGGAMFVPAALAALRRGARMALSPGEQTRDFVYVDDVAELVVRALAGDAPAGTFNAGTGRELRLREAARHLARAIGPDAEALLDFGAMPYREGEQMRYALDPSRTAAQLGWRAQVAFEDGIRRVAAGAAVGPTSTT